MSFTFDERLERLVSSLRDLSALLREYGEMGWAAWMERGRERVEHFDYYGFADLLGAFGGMGSLNDLFVHRMNGHAIDEANVGQVNERLAQLRSLVWTDAHALKAELDRS